MSRYFDEMEGVPEAPTCALVPRCRHELSDPPRVSL